jgi:hypothetical protein
MTPLATKRFTSGTVMSSGDIGGAVDNGLNRIEQFLKNKHKIV